MIYLDTHAVVWLYEGDLSRFTPSGISAMEQNDLLISPAVCLELTFLKEINRITVDALVIIETLRQSVSLQICNASFDRVVVESIRQNWTRDPFDRLIVGQASVINALLLTKDNSILAAYEQALW